MPSEAPRIAVGLASAGLLVALLAAHTSPGAAQRGTEPTPASLGSVPAGASGPCPADEPGDDDFARSVLARDRPFALTDRDLFHTFERREWADSAPLSLPQGPPPSEAETKEALRAFLRRRYPCDPQRVLDALAVLSDPLAREKIPEPTLRAALAALAGTIGQPAIGYVLAQVPVTRIHFGVYLLHGEGFPGHFAGTYRYRDGTVEAVIDRRYRALPFAALSALVLHETLHLANDDEGAGLPEESIASSFEALVYMEMLLTDPSLALLPDELTRFNSNHLALVRLNSAPHGSDRLTLFVPDGSDSIDPLSPTPLTEFYEYRDRFRGPGDPEFRDHATVGNDLLRRMLLSLSEGEAPPEDADFDRATLEYLDRNQGALSPSELLRVACILRLDVPCAEAA